jgi:hypothetical protein
MQALKAFERRHGPRGGAAPCDSIDNIRHGWLFPSSDGMEDGHEPRKAAIPDPASSHKNCVRIRREFYPSAFAPLSCDSRPADAVLRHLQLGGSALRGRPFGDYRRLQSFRLWSATRARGKAIRTHGCGTETRSAEQGVQVSASPIRMRVQKGLGSETTFLADFCGSPDVIRAI